LTSVKNIKLTIQRIVRFFTGYTPSVGFLGSSRPSLGFYFGSQDDVRYEAAKNGYWDYQEFNQNFTQVTNKMFKATANVDLFPDLK
jgi:cell surface protein SprA